LIQEVLIQFEKHAEQYKRLKSRAMKPENFRREKGDNNSKQDQPNNLLNDFSNNIR